MGCAAGKPVGPGMDSGGPDGSGSGYPQRIQVPTDIDPNINISAITSKGLAFEVKLDEEDKDMIKKHPPKRLQRLEDIQMSSLTHRLLDEKQAEAEQRRQQILSQRIQSAKSRQKLKRVPGVNGESNGLLIESFYQEPTTVEL